MRRSDAAKIRDDVSVCVVGGEVERSVAPTATWRETGWDNGSAAGSKGR